MRSGPATRGSQYGSRAFRQVLQQAQMIQSMSARANPYHNAWTESFMATLKAEMLQKGRFINAADARAEIFAFIDGYDNTQRLHSSLNYRPPHHFESEIALSNYITFGPIIRGISGRPAKGAFDHPASWQENKPSLACEA